jgi:hypothetical protein
MHKLQNLSSIMEWLTTLKQEDKDLYYKFLAEVLDVIQKELGK